MNSHLTEEQLIGYVHHTLTDAQREAMNQHLAACPECRARRDEHEALQQRIRNDLLAEMKTVRPSSDMTFATIEPRLKRRSRSARVLQWPRQWLPGAAALVGLVIAVVGLTVGIGQGSADFTTASTPHTLPTLACFLFAVPVASNLGKSRLFQPQKVALAALTLILWLGLAVVGLYEIYLIREIFFCIYARFWSDYWAAAALGQWLIFLSAGAWLALVIGSGEYHYRHLGQRSSWKLSSWIIGGELFILGLAYLI